MLQILTDIQLKEKKGKPNYHINHQRHSLFFSKLILPKYLHWNLNNKKTEILRKHILLWYVKAQVYDNKKNIRSSKCSDSNALLCVMFSYRMSNMNMFLTPYGQVYSQKSLSCLLKQGHHPLNSGQHLSPAFLGSQLLQLLESKLKRKIQNPRGRKKKKNNVNS